MKYDLVVRYAGQELVFKDLEHDDEALVDEDTPSGQAWGVNENNVRIVENFYENVETEIMRHEDKPKCFCGAGWPPQPHCPVHGVPKEE